MKFIIYLSIYTSEGDHKMEIIFTILIFAGISLLIIALQIKNTANSKPKKKTNKKSKYYNPQNNYFKNNPEHTDITHEYIESIWEEINK